MEMGVLRLIELHPPLKSAIDLPLASSKSSIDWSIFIASTSGGVGLLCFHGAIVTGLTKAMDRNEHTEKKKNASMLPHVAKPAHKSYEMRSITCVHMHRILTAPARKGSRRISI